MARSRWHAKHFNIRDDDDDDDVTHAPRAERWSRSRVAAAVVAAVVVAAAAVVVAAEIGRASCRERC